MQKNLEQDLKGLQDLIIKMANATVDMITRSTQALLTQNIELAKEVLTHDEDVDKMEVEVDERVSKLLALQQPVAIDLRVILGILKMSADLERVSDHAVNISESAITLIENGYILKMEAMEEMVAKTIQMLRRVILAFVERDTIVAKGVLETDDDVDALNKEIINAQTDLMAEDTKRIKTAMEIIRISKNLERAADLATNMAEEVIYISEAKFVKHGNR
jgi:phosphate transport system protein